MPCVWKYVLHVVFLFAISVQLTNAVGKQAVGSEDLHPLGDQLLELIGLGKGTCKKVTELARAALKPATALLEGLATIKPDKNAERALHRWVNKQL